MIVEVLVLAALFTGFDQNSPHMQGGKTDISANWVTASLPAKRAVPFDIEPYLMMER